MKEPSLLCVTHVARSDPGRDPDKQVNEDAHGAIGVDGTFLAVLCDGMGGHSGGRLASHTAVDTIVGAIGRAGKARIGDEPSTRERLERALGLASEAVHRLGADAPLSERPGATCVAAWLHRDVLEVGYAGDSRCYLWRSGTLRQLTRDHTVVEAWIEAGRIGRDEAEGHPEAHRITRALGIHPNVEVDFIPTEPLMAGDKVLLCSDGLTDLVTDAEISNQLSRIDPLARVASDLIDLANIRGGHDNVTVVLLQLGAVDRGETLADVGAGPDGERAILSKCAVVGTATEQFAGRAPGADRTLAMAPTDRTLLMQEVLVAPATELDTGARRTQPLVPNAPKVGSERLAQPGLPTSIPPVGPSSRRLWLVLVVCLLVVVLAIVTRLIRR